MRTIALLLLLAFAAEVGYAQNRYWISTSGGSWNNPANWSTASGGAGGASVPGASEVAIFNALRNGDCTLDVAPTVGGITMNGYSGSINFNGLSLTTTGTNVLATGAIMDGSGGASFILNTTGSTTFSGTSIGVPVTGSTRDVAFNGSTFARTVDITKTGSNTNTSVGGTTFQQALTLTNAGSGDVNLGNVNGDTFNGPVVATNTGTGRINLAYDSPGNVFAAGLTINHGGNTDGANTIVARNANGRAVINGTVILNCTNLSPNSGIIIANNGQATINGNIIVSSTSGRGIFFGGDNGATAGTVTFGPGTNLTSPAGTFTAGVLSLIRVTQTGTTAHALTLDGTTQLIIGPSTSLNGDVTFAAPQVNLNGGTFNGTTTIEKTGASDNYSSGGNIFNGTTTLTNSGSGEFIFGNGNADQFAGATTFNNIGSSRIRFAHNHPGQTTTFASAVTLNSNKTSGTDNWSFLFGEVNDSNLSFGGNVTLNIQGALQSTCRFLNGPGSTGTFNGSLTINVTNTHANTVMQWGVNGTAQYNGDIVISNSGGAQGITFNLNASASSTLASGRTITLGPGGFTAGTLILNRFTQLGTTPQELTTFSGISRLTLNAGTTFNGPVNIKTPAIQLNGVTVNNNATIEKTGTYNDTGAGGNTFNGTTTITSSGSGYLLTGSNNADAFNGPATFINSGTGEIYLAHSHTNQTTVFASDATFINARTSANSTVSFFFCEYPNTNVNFRGNVTFDWGGTANSTLRLLGNSTCTAVFDGNVYINNTNTGTSTNLYMGLNGTTTYNGNIEITQTGSINGVYFNNNTNASSTLAAGRTITLGSGGFVSGMLSLPRFTQIGTTPQTLNTFSGTARLVVGPTSQFGGNVDFKAPQINLTNSVFDGTARIEKTGPTDNGSGGNTFNGVTTITNSSPAYLLFGNNNADTFNEVTTFNNIGGYRMYVAHSHSGQVTTFAKDVTFYSNKTSGTDAWSFMIAESADCAIAFKGNASFICEGPLQSDFRILSGTGSSFTAAGTVTVANLSGHTSTTINMGTNGTSAYNGNLVLSNVANGIAFNNNASATATLAPNRTVSIGPDGFTRGTLSMQRFTQISATAQNVTLTGTGRFILGPSSSFDGNVDFRAPQMILNGTTYNGTTLLEKTGATDNFSIGGNIFNGTTTINNSGSAEFIFGNNTSDAFNATTVFNNTGSSSRIRIAYNHLNQTTSFAGDVTLNSNKTSGTDGWSFLISDGNASNVSFGGKLTINALGSLRGDFRFLNGAGTTGTYNGDVTINNASTHASTIITMGSSGISTYNGNIIVSNSGGASGISFNSSTSASSTLADGRSISLGPDGFTAGTLSLLRFTQLGSTTQQTMIATNTGTASFVIGPNSTFNANVNFAAPQMFLNGGTYNGAITTLEKSGANNNNSNGGNVFNGLTSITHSGSGYFVLGNGLADTFNGATSINNIGSSRMYIANNHAGQTTTFTDVTLNAFKSSGTDGWAFLLAENGNNTNISASGNFTINCGGSLRSDYRFLQGGVNTAATFNGLLTVNVSNTNANTVVVLGANGTTAYNGDIVVSNHGGAQGIYFNQNTSASSTLANGRSISIGASGFTGGTLQMPRFTQSGLTPQTLNTFTGNATLIVGPASAFGGNVNFIAPQVYLNGAVYNGTAYIEKNGATINDHQGGNTFNGTATVVNSGSARMRLANGSSGDAFNAAVTFVKNASGGLEPAYNFTNTFGGNITMNTNATVTFGSGNGVVEFTGAANQTLSKVGSTSSPVYQRMRLNKSTNNTVTLAHDLTIATAATFIQGIVNSSATNLLNFADNATAGSANDLSYVAGPMRKTGNDTFTFPVGAGGFYRPIALASAPVNVNDHFTAEYFRAGQTYGGKTTWDPSFYTVSGCEYWILNRTNGTSNVNVGLSWNEAACSVGDVTDPSTLRVTRWNGSAWVNHGNGGTTGSNINGTIVTSAAVTNFSPFTLASTTGSNPLPITLERFWAVNNTGTVTLKWITATETNNANFTLQRSANGFDFETIYTTSGAGTSYKRTEYSHTDDGPLPGQSYYRLIQTDYDGNSKSWIVSVKRDGEDETFDIWPNPASDEVVYFSQKVSIVIINNLGQVVATQNGVQSLNAGSLPAGIYTIRNQKGQVARLVRK